MVGKTIAASGGTRPIFVTLLRNAGIDPAKVNFVPVGTDPSSLVARQVEGYTGLATNQGSMLKSKGVEIELVLLRELGYHIYTGALYSSEDRVAADRAMFVAFLRAAIKGHSYMLQNPAEAAKLTVQKYAAPGMSLDAASLEAKDSMPYITDAGAVGDRLLWIDPKRITNEIAIHAANGAIPKPFPPTDLIDDTLIRDAHAAK
jgi:ABC-type nitrate/sulfonate/bicarbonate transport system substrate-binding protein